MYDIMSNARFSLYQNLLSHPQMGSYWELVILLDNIPSGISQTCETKFQYSSKSPEANSSCYITILGTCS